MYIQKYPHQIVIDESGFRSMPEGFKKISQPCMDRSHNPPSHLHIPSHQEYVHVCPSCGQKFVLKGSQVTY